MVEPLEPTQE